MDRGNRRRRQRRVFDHSVPSPCVALCQIDDATGLCRGCFRNCDEIRDWMVMTRTDKLAVLDKIKGRRESGEGKNGQKGTATETV